MPSSRRRLQREALLLRDGPNCYYCGNYTTSIVPDGHPLLRTVEHLIPRSNGGNNQLNNLVISCFTCNNGKDGFSSTPWKRVNKKLNKFRNSFITYYKDNSSFAPIKNFYKTS